MSSRTGLKTRGKKEGSICFEHKRWYWRRRAEGRSKLIMLRNEDGTPCTNRKDATQAAERYKKLLLVEQNIEVASYIAEQKKLVKRSTVTLNDVWKIFQDSPTRPTCTASTLKNHHGIWNRFMRWMEEQHPEIHLAADVDETVVGEYFTAVWARGISGKTYNDNILSLRLIFRYLMVSAELEKNPFDNIPKKPQEVERRKDFTEEQVKQIFQGFQTGFFLPTNEKGDGQPGLMPRKQYIPMYADEMKVLLELCCWTGCRGGDGCLMKWDNVDLGKNQISFAPKKTANKTNFRKISIPIHPQLREGLKQALTWRIKNKTGEGYVLPSVAERYHHNPSGIQKDVKKIIHCATGLETTAPSTPDGPRRKLGINLYGLHSFRHTFVSFCANANINPEVIAALVGHGNPVMTEHYMHISLEAKQEAIKALPSLEQHSIMHQTPTMLRAMVEQNLEQATLEQLKAILDILNPPIEI